MWTTEQTFWPFALVGLVIFGFGSKAVAHKGFPRVQGAVISHCEKSKCLHIQVTGELIMNETSMAWDKGIVKWPTGLSTEVLQASVNLSTKVMTFTTKDHQSGLANLSTMEFIIF